MDGLGTPSVLLLTLTLFYLHYAAQGGGESKGFGLNYRKL